MRCKKCKNYIKEGDWEFYLAHVWSSHGINIEDTKGTVKKLNPDTEIDDNFIKDLIKKHRQTGKASAGMFKKKMK